MHQNVDVKKFSKKEQEIINELISYYKKPSKIKEGYLNDIILNLYMTKEAKAQEDDEEHDNEVNNKVNNEDNFRDVNNDLKYPMDEVIELEKHSMEKLLSLYNITLETDLDSDVMDITCEGQLNFSWPYKKSF